MAALHSRQLVTVFENVKNGRSYMEDLYKIYFENFHVQTWLFLCCTMVHKYGHG